MAKGLASETTHFRAPGIAQARFGRRHVRVLILVALAMLAACDPAVSARFDLSPQPGQLATDPSFVSKAAALGRDVARRYALTSAERGDCPWGAYYADDTAHGRQFILSLCIGTVGKDLRVRVVEAITFYWGPKGAALRDELADSLKSAYGTAVKSDISRR